MIFTQKSLKAADVIEFLGLWEWKDFLGNSFFVMTTCHIRTNPCGHRINQRQMNYSDSQRQPRHFKRRWRRKRTLFVEKNPKKIKQKENVHENMLLHTLYMYEIK